MFLKRPHPYGMATKFGESSYAMTNLDAKRGNRTSEDEPKPVRDRLRREYRRTITRHEILHLT